MDILSIVLLLPLCTTVFSANELYDCLTANACPVETPFCTSVGCIAKCPANSYENGSTCSLDCGQMFADENKCTSECPNDKTYIMEKVFVTKDGFKKMRVCKSVCDEGFYSINNTCVQQCSTEFPYKLNRNVQIKPYIVSKERKCVKTCPDKLLIQEDECVFGCSFGYFSSNGTCVQNCPSEYSYKLNYYPNRKCVSECPAKMVKQGDTCQRWCSDGYYNASSTCVKTCPDEAPYIVVKAYSNGLPPRQCVSECPGQMVLQGIFCKSNCYDGYLNANRTCVDICPETLPYVNSVNKQCIAKCPGDQATRGKKCIYCTENVYKNDCVSQCPMESPLYSELCKNGRFCCVNACPLSTYMNVRNGSCVPRCPADMKVHNRTCVSRCPFTLPYSYDKCKGEMYPIGPCSEVCMDECPNNTFLLKNDMTCVSRCPNLQFRKLCVSDCPNGFYIHKSLCMNACPQSTYVHNGSCVSRCPADMKVHNHTCVLRCPTTSPYFYNACKMETYPSGQCSPWKHIYTPDICMNKCPNNAFVLNFTCAKQCPNVSINRTCLYQCPVEAPYIKDNECVSNCGKDYLANGSECIKKYNCDLIQYNGQCLTVCPEGTYWVGNCLSHWLFTVCIVIPLVVVPVWMLFFIKCFKFQPSICCRRCRASRKQEHTMDYTDYIPLLQSESSIEEDASQTGGHGFVV